MPVRGRAAAFPLFLIALNALSDAQELSVYTIVSPPFITNDLTGFESDVWAKTVAIMQRDSPGLTYRWVVTDSVVDALNRTAHDPNGVAIAQISMTDKRLKQVDFSQPYFTSGVNVLTRWRSTRLDILLMFEPFTWEVWVSVLVLVYFSGHVIWFLEKDWQPKCFPRSYLKGVNEGIWWCWSIVTRTIQVDLVGFPSRMYAAGWMFLAVILLASYTASLASFMTVANLDKGIERTSDLSGRNVASVPGTTGTQYIRHNLANVHYYGFPTIQECFDALLADEVAAVLYDGPILANLQRRFEEEDEGNNELRILNPRLTTEFYAIATYKNSTYLPAINDALLELKGSIRNGQGELERLYRSYFLAPDHSNDYEFNLALQITAISGVYIFLVLGIIASCSSWFWIHYGDYFY